MKPENRTRVATALGYYARAADPEASTLNQEIELYALTEYRNDIDCQIAFRKGYQQAEEHLQARGLEAKEIIELVKWLQKLENEVYRQRLDIREFLVRQEAQNVPRYGGGGGWPPVDTKRT